MKTTILNNKIAMILSLGLASISIAETVQPEHYFDLKRLEPCTSGNGFTAVNQFYRFVKARAVALKDPGSLPSTFRSAQSSYEKKVQQQPSTWNERSFSALALESKAAGAGFELERVRGNMVNIWRVWPDMDGSYKRISLLPMVSIDESTIHPLFFAYAKKGNYAALDNPLGPKPKTKAINPEGATIQTLPNGSVIIAEKKAQSVDKNGGKTSNLDLMLLSMYLDLMCMDPEGHKIVNSGTSVRGHHRSKK